MNLFTLDRWPLLLICAAMIASAIIDWWKFKVPNWLTLPTIVAGWLLGAGYDIWGSPLEYVPPGWRFLASLACTLLGFLLLGWMRALKMMGGGDVKMQMGFGAWIGAYFGISTGPWVVLYAWIFAVIAGGIIGLGMMLLGDFRQHLKNMREIAIGFFQAGGSPALIRKQSEERNPRYTRLPYGVPLCIGFLTYLYFFLS